MARPHIDFNTPAFFANGLRSETNVARKVQVPICSLMVRLMNAFEGLLPNHLPCDDTYMRFILAVASVCECRLIVAERARLRDFL